MPDRLWKYDPSKGQYLLLPIEYLISYTMNKKLFYVVDNGVSSLTAKPGDLENILKNAFEDYDEKTPEDELPCFTVSPVYMTQEEYDNMPEYKGE